MLQAGEGRRPLAHPERAVFPWRVEDSGIETVEPATLRAIVPCLADTDVDGSGVVEADDLLVVILGWGDGGRRVS